MRRGCGPVLIKLCPPRQRLPKPARATCGRGFRESRIRIAFNTQVFTRIHLQHFFLASTPKTVCIPLPRHRPGSRIFCLYETALSNSHRYGPQRSSLRRSIPRRAKQEESRGRLQVLSSVFKSAIPKGRSYDQYPQLHLQSLRSGPAGRGLMHVSKPARIYRDRNGRCDHRRGE